MVVGCCDMKMMGSRYVGLPQDPEVNENVGTESGTKITLVPLHFKAIVPETRLVHLKTASKQSTIILYFETMHLGQLQ